MTNGEYRELLGFIRARTVEAGLGDVDAAIVAGILGDEDSPSPRHLVLRYLELLETHFRLMNAGGRRRIIEALNDALDEGYVERIDVVPSFVERVGPYETFDLGEGRNLEAAIEELINLREQLVVDEEER